MFIYKWELNRINPTTHVVVIIWFNELDKVKSCIVDFLYTFGSA